MCYALSVLYWSVFVLHCTYYAMLYSINNQQLTFFLVGTDELHDNLFLRGMLILRGHDRFVYTSLEEKMDEVLQHMDTT